MKKILYSLFIFSVIGLCAYGIQWKLSQNKTMMEEELLLAESPTKQTAVNVATINRQVFSNNFSVNGTFQPSKKLTVAANATGQIIRFRFEDGDYVKRKQELLRVDNTLLRNELKMTIQSMEKAKKDYGRMKNLLKDGGVTAVQVEDAALGVDQLGSKVRALEKRVSDTYLYAPISGIISGKKVEQGSFVAPGTPIATIVDIRTIHLVVYLTERQVVPLKKGQKIKITADVYPNQDIIGSVHFIDVMADNNKRFKVEIALANPKKTPLKAGMNGKAHFELGTSIDMLVIPRQSFAGSVEDGQVFVVENQTAILKTVIIGNTFGDQIEILEGLEEGEQIVLTGHIHLKDGAMVKNILE